MAEKKGNNTFNVMFVMSVFAIVGIEIEEHLSFKYSIIAIMVIITITTTKILFASAKLVSFE